MGHKQKIISGIIVTVMLIAGIFMWAVPAQAEFPPEKVTITAPSTETSVGLNTQLDVTVFWTWYPDTLFYRVLVEFMPDEEREVRYIEFRYVPDKSYDWRRDDSRLQIPVGYLDVEAWHTVTVTPFGATHELIETYNANRYNPPPTDLPLDWYEQLTPPSDPIFIYRSE